MEGGFEKQRFIERARAYALHHARSIPTVALFGGLVWDYLTLGRPDSIYGNTILVIYFTIAAGCIVLLNLKQRRKEEEGRFSILLLSLMQFSFGSLTSGLIILYGQSGTLSGNWLFFLSLALFLIGNEFLRGRYARLPLHLGAFYLLLLSYLSLATPVLLGEMGPMIFLTGGLISLGAMFLFVGGLYVISPPALLSQARRVGVTILLIFGLFSLLYFTNLIPPVPLALKEIGIFHNVVREEGGGYRLTYEEAPWFIFWRASDDVYRRLPGESAYCWSSVFAPVGLSAPIYHRWEFLNTARGSWEDASRIAFSIHGGRAEGYRGFSIKSALSPGWWRCSVETERGQLIGRMTFRVEEVDGAPSLFYETR